MWKTKQVTRENGTKSRTMICQNSNVELSKWADYAPEDEKCTNYTEVGEKAVSSLCCECTARSVNGI